MEWMPDMEGNGQNVLESWNRKNFVENDQPENKISNNEKWERRKWKKRLWEEGWGGGGI